MSAKSLKDLQEQIVAFREERDWKQFHNPKDLAISLVLEAAEVMEHFQWKNTEEMQTYIEKNKGEIAEELADTLYWILLMANDLGIDVLDAAYKKMDKNAAKYPADKARGVHTKYDKL